MGNKIESLERFRGITTPINNIASSDQRTLRPIDQVYLETQILAKDRQLYNELSGANLMYRPNLQLHIDPTYGQSKFDYAATSITDMRDLTDLRAREQSQWAKLGNGLFNTGVRTVTSTVEALSFIPGALRAIVPTEAQKAAGTNWWSRWMENSITSSAFQSMVDLEEEMGRKFPNYRSYKEQDTNWTTRMITPQYMIDFWIDDIFKNIGFSWGTLLGTRAAIKGLTAAGRFVGNGGRRLAQAAAKTGERNVRRLTVKQLSHELGKPMNMNELKEIVSNAASSADAKAVASELLRRQRNLGIFESVAGSVISAGSEAHYESVLAAKSIMEEQKKRLDQWYANPNNEDYLRQMYNNYLKTTLTPMSFEQYKQNVYDESLMQIQDSANKAAGLIMAFELPLLSLSTWVTFRRFFNSGFHSYAIGRNWNKINKLGSDFNDWKLRKMFTEVRDKSGNVIGLKTNFKRLDKVTPFVPIFAEGAEEMGQRFISSTETFRAGAKFNNYFSQYYDDIFNDNYKAEANIYLNSLAYGAKNTFMQSEGWLEGFSGAILGLLGGINFRKTNLQSQLHDAKNQEVGNTDEENTETTVNKSLLSKLKEKISKLPKPNFENGAISKLKTLHDAEKLVQQCVDYVNDIMGNEVNRERVRNLLRTLAINQRMSQAIDNNDAKTFKDAELEELLTIIHNFDILGQREHLEKLLDEVESTQDPANRNLIKQEFAEHKEDLKPEDQNIDEDEFIQRVVKEVGVWRQTLKDYTEHYNIVDQFFGDTISDKTKHMIASLGTAAADREIRLQELYKTVAQKLSIEGSELTIDEIIDGKTVIPGLQQILNGLNETIQQYNKDNADNYDEKELINKLSAYLNNELIKIIPAKNFDPNTPSEIVDLFNIYHDYVTLSNQYKSLLTNPEAIKNLEQFNVDVDDQSEPEENTQEDSFLQSASQQPKTAQAQKLSFVNNVSKLIDVLSQNVNIPSNINAQEILDKIQQADSLDEVQQIVNDLGTDLDNNLQRFSTEDEVYKQSAHLYNIWSNLFAYNDTSSDITDYLQQRNAIINEFRSKILKMIEDNETLKKAFEKNKTQFDSSGRFLMDLFNKDNMRMSFVQDPATNEKYVEIQIGNVVMKLSISNKFEVIKGTANTIKFDSGFELLEDTQWVVFDPMIIFSTVCDELSTLGILTDELKDKIQKLFKQSFENVAVGEYTGIQSVNLKRSKIEAPLSKSSLDAKTDETNLRLRDQIYQLAVELRANLANIKSSSTVVTAPTTVPQATTTPAQSEPVSPEAAPEPEPAPTPNSNSETEQELAPETTTPETQENANIPKTENKVPRGVMISKSMGANSLPFLIQLENTVIQTTSITEHDLAKVNPNEFVINDNYINQLRRWADGTDPKWENGELVTDVAKRYYTLLIKLYEKMRDTGVYRYINTHYFAPSTKLKFKVPEDDSLQEGEFKSIEVVAVTSENNKQSEHTVGYITVNNEHYYAIEQSGVDNKGYYNIEGSVKEYENGQIYQKPYTSEDETSMGMSMQELENDIDRTDNHFYGFIDGNGQFVANQPQNVDSMIFKELIDNLTNAYKQQEGAGKLLRKGVPMVIVSRKPIIATSTLNDYSIRQLQPREWDAGNQDDLSKVRDLASRIVRLRDLDGEQLTEEVKTINKILLDNFVFYLDKEKGELSETGFFQVYKGASVVINVCHWVKNERTGKFERKPVEYTIDDKKITDSCWVWQGMRHNEEQKAIEKAVQFLFNRTNINGIPVQHSTPVQSITTNALHNEALDINGNQRGVKELIKEGSVRIFITLSPYNCGIKFDLDENFEKEIEDHNVNESADSNNANEPQARQIEDTPVEEAITNDDQTFLKNLQENLNDILQNQPLIVNLAIDATKLKRYVKSGNVSQEDYDRYKQIKASQVNSVKKGCNN